MSLLQGSYQLNFGGRPSVPVILQTEAAECGLACLAMISGHFGHPVTLASLRRRYPSSMRGTTLRRLTDIARGMDLHCRPLRL